jgi:hypothetical protein
LNTQGSRVIIVVVQVKSSENISRRTEGAFRKKEKQDET